MTLEQLYQPITSIFTADELYILPQLCEAQAKRYAEYARKANDAERAIDMQLVDDHTQQQEALLDLAERLQGEDMIVEDLKEEWIAEMLIREINARVRHCKAERAAFYQALIQKITDLIY